jgi:hypothetical protein
VKRICRPEGRQILFGRERRERRANIVINRKSSPSGGFFLAKADILVYTGGRSWYRRICAGKDADGFAGIGETARDLFYYINRRR